MQCMPAEKGSKDPDRDQEVWGYVCVAIYHVHTHRGTPCDGSIRPTFVVGHTTESRESSFSSLQLIVVCGEQFSCSGSFLPASLWCLVLVGWDYYPSTQDVIRCCLFVSPLLSAY